MTPEQLAAFGSTIKAAILADPVLAPLASGPGTDYDAIAKALSAVASPEVLAWKTAVTPEDTDGATPWDQFDSIAQAGKRDSFLHAFLRYPRNYARNATRKWVTDVWGNATAGSNAEKILTAAREPALRVEVIVGGATKTTNNVSALDRNYQGGVAVNEVGAILAS